MHTFQYIVSINFQSIVHFTWTSPLEQRELFWASKHLEWLFKCLHHSIVHTDQPAMSWEDSDPNMINNDLSSYTITWDRTQVVLLSLVKVRMQVYRGINMHNHSHNFHTTSDRRCTSHIEKQICRKCSKTLRYVLITSPV